MARVFAYNPLVGSLKDEISGVIPQNFNNATIQQGQKGRVLQLNGTNYLDYDLPNFRSSDNTGTIAFVFRGTGLSAEGIIFSSADVSIGNNFCDLILTPAGAIKFFFFNNGVIGSPVISPGANDELWHLGVISSNGSRYQMFVDNIDYTPSITGNNSGAWLADVIDRDNVVIGALVRAIPLSFMKAQIGFIYIDDEEINANERGRLWEEFLDSRTLLTNKILSDGTLDISNFNWDATGQVQSQFIGNGDFAIGSGSFKCLEDSIDKYIECVTNGTLQVRGHDLSIFPENGFIKRIDGDLSANQGLTVDASILSFFGNVLSIPMTTGQKIRNLTIGHNV